MSLIESNNFRFTADATATEIYISLLAVIGIVFAFVYPLIIFYTYRQAVKQQNIKFTQEEIVDNMVRFSVEYKDLFTQPYLYHSDAYT